MGEKVKNKDAEPEESRTSELDEGLEDTFPSSDPLSSTQPGNHDAENASEEKPSRR